MQVINKIRYIIPSLITSDEMASWIFSALVGPYPQTEVKGNSLRVLGRFLAFFGRWVQHYPPKVDGDETTQGQPVATEQTAERRPVAIADGAGCRPVATGHAGELGPVDTDTVEDWEPTDDEDDSKWELADAEEKRECDPIDLEQAAEWEDAAWDDFGNLEEATQWGEETMRKPEEIELPDHNVHNRLEANKLSREAQTARVLFVRLQLDDKLGDELEEDSRNVVVDNFTAHELLDEGMKVLKRAFLETSRVYWPPAFGLVKRGHHLVDTPWTGMGYYFRIIELEGLKEVLPRTEDLKELLVAHNNETRNRLAHPEYKSFANSSEVDVRLQIMQAAILIMGDQERVNKLRDLRDRLAAEAKRVVDKVMDMGRQAGDPLFEVSEDGREFLDDWDVRFYNILYEQGRFDGHRLDENDPMLRIARFYSKQRIYGKRCQAFENGPIEYW